MSLLWNMLPILIIGIILSGCTKGLSRDDKVIVDCHAAKEIMSQQFPRLATALAEGGTLLQYPSTDLDSLSMNLIREQFPSSSRHMARFNKIVDQDFAILKGLLEGNTSFEHKAHFETVLERTAPCRDDYPENRIQIIGN